jgi:signal transduction histidine kinase
VTPRRSRRDRELAARRELFAVLAHELRSPIGAILGFEELLSDGILGEMPPAAADALQRIGSSARQLLDLVAGLGDLSLAGSDTAAVHRAETALAPLLDAVLAALQTEAAGRGTGIHLRAPAELPVLFTDGERLQRALQLVLMAALKSSAGGTITLRVRGGKRSCRFDVTGSRLEPLRDDPDVTLKASAGPRLTAAGLRIAMARQALHPLQGEIVLQLLSAGVTLRLVLPHPVPGD